MISVGITGGIGSGKTSVCQFFETLAVPIYYADDRAKWLMNNDNKLKSNIINAFGETSYQSDGTLNRAHLSSIVFNNDSELKKLNNLVHPAVWNDTSEWMQKHAKEDYILYEAAILFESGSYKMLNKIITVFAPQELRIERVQKRDNVTREDVLARIAKQMPEEEKISKADYVIYNDGSQMLISQILNIHKELKSK